jgi:hypothetical protein
MKVFCLVLRCPDVKSQADAIQIKEVLSSSPGFNKVDIDVATHTLTLSTANQDAGRDILLRLSHAGFPAEDPELALTPHERT